MVKYVIFMSRPGRGLIQTLEKMRKTIFNYKNEEKKKAIRIGKLGLHFLKWE